MPYVSSGVTINRVEVWVTNRKSTISGSRTHEFGESYTNVMAGHPELICKTNKKQWDEEYKALLIYASG